MARTYSATSDQHRFPLATQMTGAFSIGAWVKRASDTTFDTFYSRCTSASAAKVAVQILTSGKIGLELAGVAEKESTLTVKEADGWVFIGVDKAAGSAIARCHVWKQASGWTHQAMGTALGNPVTAGASATIRIGEWQGGTTDNFSGDIEVVVEYNGKQLADVDWESAAFARQGMLAKTPTGMWELRQAEVTQKVYDLSGNGANESVRAGTAVATRSCPFYFAGGPPVRSYQPAAAGGKALKIELADSAGVSESRGKKDATKRADSVTSTEARSLRPALKRADAVTPAEARKLLAALKRGDALTPAEVRKLSAVLKRADALTPTEARALRVALKRGDSAAFVDALKRRAGVARADSVALSELRLRVWAAKLKLADTIPLNEKFAKALAKAIKTDTQAVSDAIAHVWAAHVGLADHLAPTEARQLRAALKRKDTAAVVDVIHRAAGRSLHDSSSVSDAHHLAVGHRLSEHIGATDAIHLGFGALLGIGHTFAVSDALHRAWAAHLKLADGQSITDAMHRALAKHLADAILASEASKRHWGAVRKAQETFAVSDEIIPFLGQLHDHAEFIVVEDVLKHVWKALLKRADSISPTDSTRFSVGHHLADAVAPAETRKKAVGKPAKDTLTALDARKLALGKLRAELVSFAEAHHAAAGLRRKDTAVVAEALHRALRLQLKDSVLIVDAWGKALGLRPHEAIVFVDALTTLHSLGIEVHEAITVADALRRDTTMALEDAVALIDKASPHDSSARLALLALTDLLSTHLALDDQAELWLQVDDQLPTANVALGDGAQLSVQVDDRHATNLSLEDDFA